MKYIFLRDFSALIRNKKVIFFYTVSLLLFFNIAPTLKIDDIYIKTLGLVMTKKFIEMLLYLLNLSFYTYLIIALFLADFKLGGQNVFSRIKKKKYMFNKMLSMSFFMFFLKTFFHIIIGIWHSEFSIILWLKDVLFIEFLLSLIVFFFYIFSLNKKVMFALIVAFLWVISTNMQMLSIINYNIYLLILLIIIFNVVCTSFSKYLFYLYERID